MIGYILYLLYPPYAKKIILKRFERALRELGEDGINIDESNIEIRPLNRYYYLILKNDKGNLRIIADPGVLRYGFSSLGQHEAVHFYILGIYGELDYMGDLGVDGVYSEAQAYLRELGIQLENCKGDKLDILIDKLANRISIHESIDYSKAVKKARNIIKKEGKYLLANTEYKKPVTDTLSKFIYSSLGKGRNRKISKIMAKSIMNIFYKNVDKYNSLDEALMRTIKEDYLEYRNRVIEEYGKYLASNRTKVKILS